MREHTLITLRECVVRLVHDDVLKIILREHRKPFLLAKRLHRTHRHGKETAEAAVLPLLKGSVESREHLQLIGGLSEKFPTMRHDENTMVFLYLLLRKRGKHDGFAAVMGNGEIRQQITVVSVHGKAVVLPTADRFYMKPCPQDGFFLLTLAGNLPFHTTRDDRAISADGDAVIFVFEVPIPLDARLYRCPKTCGAAEKRHIICQPS